MGFENGGCNITQINGNTKIEGDCGNVEINGNSINISSNKGEKFNIKGDQKENLSSISENITIGKNIKTGVKISNVSGDINIGGDNLGSIKSVSGDVSIKENKGNVTTVSGDVDITENDGDIVTVSGDVDIKNNNSKKIKTVSGKIVILENNNGILETTSGNINILGNNTNKIHTLSGTIKIGEDLSVHLVRNGVFNGNNSNSIITNGISINSNNINSNNSNSIITNGISINNNNSNIAIINGKEIANSTDNNEKKLIINGIKIDLIKKEIYFKNKKITTDDFIERGYTISEDFKTIKYNGQEIKIADDGLNIDYLLEDSTKKEKVANKEDKKIKNDFLNRIKNLFN